LAGKQSIPSQVTLKPFGIGCATHCGQHIKLKLQGPCLYFELIAEDRADQKRQKKIFFKSAKTEPAGTI